MRRFGIVSCMVAILWLGKCLSALQNRHLATEDIMHGFSSSKDGGNDFKSMGYLAALKREEQTFEVDVVHLAYLGHPWERRLKQSKNNKRRGFGNATLSQSKVKESLPGSGTSSPSLSPTRKEQVATISQTKLRTMSPSEFRTVSPSLAPTTMKDSPIRIVYETFELNRIMNISSSVERKVNILRQKILPTMSKIWSSTLNVVPVEGNITVNSNTCFGLYDIPKSLIREGVSNADLLIFVSGHNSLNGVLLCDGNTLASASYCSLDQFDRPVVGLINFCINNININNENASVAVGVHELAHILGFSDDLFQYYRDSNGIPLTPRPFKKKEVDCVDGSTKQRVIASKQTLQKSNNSDSVYYEIVTPTVVEIARNHFNCHSLIGARLENKPTRESCTGSHWDERFFFTDAMSPIFSSEEVSILSPLTVALLKDTGWYGVSFESEYIQNNPFGLGAGCEFLNEDSCIVDDKVPEKFDPYFCDSVTFFNGNGKIARESQTTCDPSFTHIAYCDLFDLTSTLPLELGTSKEANINKFSDPNLGSSFIEANNCPIPAIFSVDCTDPLKGLYKKLYPEEHHGIDSRCFNSIFDHPVHGGIARGVCLKSYCNRRDHTLEVYIGGSVVICNNDGDVHQFPSKDHISFVCPKLSSICPQMFCPSMCSGQGFCNYDEGPPHCKCYDEADTSPGCYGAGVQYEFNEDHPIKYPSRPKIFDPNSGIKHVSILYSFVPVITLFLV